MLRKVSVHKHEQNIELHSDIVLHNGLELEIL
jgi:hypothetical protein